MLTRPTLVALVVTNILTLAFAAAMAVNVWRAKQAKRRLRARAVPGSPIRTVPVEQFEESFAAGPHGPTPRAEVAFIAQGTSPVPGVTTDFEAWILAVFAKRARRMFEFGTSSGKTTYLWARNAPDDARVVTLTLTPEQLAQYQHAAGDSARAADFAREESRFSSFLYNGTPVEHKVVQLFGDSKQLDDAPYAAACDLVFVDGSHAYSYVVSDSEKALRMVKPGGVILWHDYVGDVPDVVRALDELSARLPLVRLAGTTLVAYRAPSGGAPAADASRTRPNS